MTEAIKPKLSGAVVTCNVKVFLSDGKFHMHYDVTMARNEGGYLTLYAGTCTPLAIYVPGSWHMMHKAPDEEKDQKPGTHELLNAEREKWRLRLGKILANNVIHPEVANLFYDLLHDMGEYK